MIEISTFFAVALAALSIFMFLNDRWELRRERRIFQYGLRRLLEESK